MDLSNSSTDDSTTAYPPGKRQKQTVNNKKKQSVKKKPAQQKKKKAIQSFRDQWLIEEPLRDWLRKNSDQSYKARCSYCGHSLTADHSVLMNHAATQTHKNNIPSKASQRSMSHFVQSSTNKTNNSLDESVKKAEIKLVAFFSEHNIALKGLDHLSDLLKNCFPDSKIAAELAVERSKGTAILKNIIGETEKSLLTDKIKKKKFSILTDESTDISGSKSSCILVRYYDEEQGKIVSKFWDLVECLVPGKVTSATAELLYNNLMTSFDERKIPRENIVGFGSNGCNVMMGKNNSVASRLRNDFPGISIFTCICHSLEICASEGCKKPPRSVEDLARNIFNFFSHSAQRKCEFVEFQKFTDTAVHKLLHPAQTRWLSLTLVVDRIIEQWNALQLHFKGKYLESKLVSAERVHHDLQNPFNKMYFLFLKWVLPKITRTNQYYQSSKVVIADLNESMIRLYQELLTSYMDESYVHSSSLSKIDPKNSKYFKINSNIYLGCDVMNEINKPCIQQEPDLLEHFSSSCHAFLIEVCSQIRSKYDFNNPLLDLMKQLKPKNALCQVQRDTTRSLIPLLTLVPRVCSKDMYQNVDDEWRHLLYHKIDDSVDLQNTEIDVFWGMLSEMKTDGGEYLFRNVSQCALALLSLPHSNCDSERIFSKINSTKTKLRNRMIVPTVRGHVLSSQHVEYGGKAWDNCVDFIPSKDMLSRMTESMYDKPNSAVTVTNDPVFMPDDEEDDEYEILFNEN